MATPPSQTLPNNMTIPHPRAPIRSTTTDYEGWMRLQEQRRSELQPVSESSPAEQALAVCPPPPKPSSPSVLLTHSRWQTDIVTFCSHIARDPLLRRAHVTEIQNRKSRKLPYLQEYILLFFAVGQRRFVALVDHGAWFRRGAKNPEPLLSQSSMCRQQVTVYHVQDGEDAATPWFEDDGSRGSEFVAALSRWSDLGASGVTVVSHHLSTARDAYSGQGPSLHDVCRLIEAVVLEAPPSCFKTASSYITSRSVLLVIRDSFPHDFACSIGEERELVPASSLEEPAAASLLQWYLPFTLIALAFYIAAVAGLHLWVSGLITTKSGLLDTVDRCPPDSTPLECSSSGTSTVAWKNALKMMMHLLLDLPFPAALTYTWLASIDLQMNGLVKRISARFLNEESDFSDTSAVVKTWVGTFSRPWFNFVVGSCLGCVLGLALFLGILLGHGVLVMLMLVIFLALAVNYALPQLDDEEIESEPDNELPLLDCDSSRSESELFPSVAGPSSPR